MAMSPIGERNASRILEAEGNDFIRYAKCLAVGQGRVGEAQRFAEKSAGSRVLDVFEISTKTAISVGTLTDPNYASALAPYKALAEGFVASMAGFSFFSTIAQAGDWFRVPLRTSIGVLTTALVGDAVSELAAKPLHAGAFGTARIEPSKVTATIVITNELARSISQAAVTQFGNELRRAASVALDAHALAILAATSGASTAASTGVTATAIQSDLTARLQAMTIGADSRLWWIVSPKLYKTMSLLQGTGGYLMVNGKIGDINIAPSDAATTAAYLIDAKQVAAELDTVVINSSSNASLQLADNPTASAYQTVPLFQMNATALRCEIYYGCVGLRGSAISTLTGYS